MTVAQAVFLLYLLGPSDFAFPDVGACNSMSGLHMNQLITFLVIPHLPSNQVPEL